MRSYDLRVRTLGAGLLLSIAVSACAHTAEAGFPARMALSGIGGVAPGMSVAQVQRAWGIPVVPTGTGHCRIARITTGGVRGHALFLDGRLGAVFFTAGVKSDRGIGIGSTLPDIRAAYGNSTLDWPAPNSATEIHIYTKARYLGDKRALRFDIDPGKSGLVTQIGLGGSALSFTTGRC